MQEDVSQKATAGATRVSVDGCGAACPLDRFAEVEKELNSATDEMVEELWARKERGEHDQEAYDRLKMAFEKTSRNWNELPDCVCDKRKCIWCFFQRVIFK